MTFMARTMKYVIRANSLEQNRLKCYAVKFKIKALDTTHPSLAAEGGVCPQHHLWTGVSAEFSGLWQLLGSTVHTKPLPVHPHSPCPQPQHIRTHQPAFQPPPPRCVLLENSHNLLTAFLNPKWEISRHEQQTHVWKEKKKKSTA